LDFNHATVVQVGKTTGGLRTRHKANRAKHKNIDVLHNLKITIKDELIALN
jgi:hypothetical protein